MADWDAWCPGERRHEERDAGGALLAFFHGAATHIFGRNKEATVWRPHGHILRSGEPRWIDGEHLGVTCYAAGIFGAQAYLGNPNLARLLSVVRNQLNVARAHGQRVFVRDGETWRQLGVPSAFLMTPGDARWIYRLDDGLIEARVWCSLRQPAAFLELRVAAEPPDSSSSRISWPWAPTSSITRASFSCMTTRDGSGASSTPRTGGQAASGPVLRHCRGGARERRGARLGRAVYADGARRGGPYAVIRTRPTRRAGVILLGCLRGSGHCLPSWRQRVKSGWPQRRRLARWTRRCD